MAQNYPYTLFEIIVVDDHSEDNTKKIVQDFIDTHNASSLNNEPPIHAAINSPSKCNFSKNYRPTSNASKIKFIQSKPLPTIILLSCPNNSHGKKQAINQAINFSSKQLIVTTDADCQYLPEWLSTIASFYNTYQPKMIIAPIVIIQPQNNLQNIQYIEQAALLAFTAYFCSRNTPILCNGANLIYERFAFHQLGGFQDIQTQASGDDILLMNKFIKHFPGRIHFLKSPQAVVGTHPVLSINDYLQQRKRWLSKKTDSLSIQSISLALLVCFVNLTIPISLIVSLFCGKFVPIFLIVISLKYIADNKVLNSVKSILSSKRGSFNFLIAELLYAFTVLYLVLLIPRKSYSWKGRRVQ